MGTTFEEAMKARIKKGFSEWNGGYEGWLKWCNTLYEPDSHYNVYGMRWTLQQYKEAMGQFFKGFDIELGNFHNIMAEGDWAAIRYEVFVTNKKTGEKIKQETMEFVHFKDNPEPIGARVIEGWALSDKPISTH